MSIVQSTWNETWPAIIIYEWLEFQDNIHPEMETTL